MAGGSIKFDDTQARASLRGLLGAVEHPAPLMAQISEYLWRTTRDRFKTQTSPQGDKWADLEPRYKASKPKAQRERILTLQGYLRGGIVKQYDARSATVGSDKVYAAIHQFGGRTRPPALSPRYKKKAQASGGGGVPARPFLGLSDADERELLEITHDFLRRQM